MKNNKQFDLDEINSKQEEIDELIGKTFENHTFDGIINPEEYTKSPIKILWILKEVNDESGYNQREAFNELAVKVVGANSTANTNRRYWWPTMDPIIYISNQILNGFLPWEDPSLSYIKDEPSMVGVLQKIAYINIKKEPGGATCNEYELSVGYEKSKNIIKQQIDLINPDVIIGGNTMRFLKDDYKLDTFKKCSDFNLSYLDNSDRLYIDSYHTQYLSRQNETFKGDYFNSIVNIVKEWVNNKN